MEKRKGPLWKDRVGLGEEEDSDASREVGNRELG